MAKQTSQYTCDACTMEFGRNYFTMKIYVAGNTVY